MGAQTNNAITALQNLAAVFTTVESGIKTGDAGFDAQIRALLTDPRIGSFVATIIDYGSRSQQNSTSATRMAANNNMPSSQEATFTAMTNFIVSMNTLITVLQNPTSVPRRTHTTLQ